MPLVVRIVFKAQGATDIGVHQATVAQNGCSDCLPFLRGQGARQKFQANTRTTGRVLGQPGGPMVCCRQGMQQSKAGNDLAVKQCQVHMVDLLQRIR